jgi:hypothetical protein
MTHPDVAKNLSEEARKFDASKSGKKELKSNAEYETLLRDVAGGKNFEDLEKSLDSSVKLGYVRKMEEKEIGIVKQEKERLNKRIENVKTGFEKEEFTQKRDNLAKQVLYYKGEAYCRNGFINPEELRKRGRRVFSKEEQHNADLEHRLFNSLKIWQNELKVII